MKKDIIIGLLVSIGAHVGVLFGGELFKPEPKAEIIEEEVAVIELLEMPPNRARRAGNFGNQR